MAGYDDKPEEVPMDRYDAWREHPLLHRIRRAAGLDPDGPRLVPMQPGLSHEQAVQAAHRAAKAVARDAALCRAIGLL